jgi:hypothetical protein
MQNNSKYLIIGFVLLAVISWFVLNNKQQSSGFDEQYLIPELQNQVNEIDQIVLTKNDKTIQLNKDKGTWHVEQSNNFIADANKVANLLLDLRKFKLKDKKTKNPQNYARLSLAETGDDAATSIKLLHAGKEISHVFIGKQAQKSQGSYVRKNGDQQTWLAQGVLKVQLDSKDWIVTSLFDIDKSQVKSVTFETADESFKINKLTPNDQMYSVVDLPSDKQVKTGFDLNTLASGLQKFAIESVVDSQVVTGDKVLSVSYELFSGVQYHLGFYKTDDKYQMKVAFDNLDNSKTYEKQLSQWAYVVAKYKFDALNKKLSDIIQDKVENKPADKEPVKSENKKVSTKPSKKINPKKHKKKPKE